MGWWRGRGGVRSRGGVTSRGGEAQRAMQGGANGEGKRKGRTWDREEEEGKVHGAVHGNPKRTEVGGKEHMAYLAVWQEACAVLGPVARLATVEADMVGVLVPLQELPTLPSLRQEAVCNNTQLMQQAHQLLCSM